MEMHAVHVHTDLMDSAQMTQQVSVTANFVSDGLKLDVTGTEIIQQFHFEQQQH